jgi:hypothetical protein
MKDLMISLLFTSTAGVGVGDTLFIVESAC